MQKVPVAITTDIALKHDTRSGEARLVSDLEAEPDATSSVIVMTLRDPGNSYPFVFALSPPAAAQLSRLLKKAVKEYLRAAPEEENQA